MAIADQKRQTETVTPSGRLGAGRRAERVQVDDTTELRWITEGPLPIDVEAWFTCGGTTGSVEQRCDTYRMDGLHHQGVKLRFRETLELKVLQAVGERLVLGAGLAGRLQVWRRWSPADGLVDMGGEVSRLDVCKIVTKRRFSAVGDEIVSSDLERATPDAGCDVEVAEITVGDIEAWTFAFAAFGPPATREHGVVAAWRALTASGACPRDLAATFGCSTSYPEWLATILASGETTSRPAAVAT